MSNSTKPSKCIFILTGMNPQQYTDARRKLNLLPAQAFWLTHPANLTGKHRPKVFRFGNWKSLARLQEIDAALATAEAEIVDL